MVEQTSQCWVVSYQSINQKKEKKEYRMWIPKRNAIPQCLDGMRQLHGKSIDQCVAWLQAGVLARMVAWECCLKVQVSCEPEEAWLSRAPAKVIFLSQLIASSDQRILRGGCYFVTRYVIPRDLYPAFATASRLDQMSFLFPMRPFMVAPMLLPVAIKCYLYRLVVAWRTVPL